MKAVCRPLEVLQAEGLQQIVDSVDTEALDGVFRVGGGEDDEGRTSERLDEVHTVEVGHVDVAEDGVDGVMFEEFASLHSTLALGSEFEERHLTDIGNELLER